MNDGQLIKNASEALVIIYIFIEWQKFKVKTLIFGKMKFRYSNLYDYY